ncbi:MAG TPA: DUF1345 domain-containing protein [Casimicrobiaceae bacterium]|nr:DUF1345 domain-containing protein [Casimicrobiaceae bacterium]
MQRLLIALGVATLVAALSRPAFSAQVSLLAAWDAFALCYLLLGWLLIGRTDEVETRRRAQRADPGGYVIFLLVVVAASASFVAIGFMVGGLAQLGFWQRAERLTLSIAALFLSWLLIHTLFAFHYARLYYYLPTGRKEHHRGLRFPDDDEPDYLDFAYYSFVVGMTSQVSDVAVLSRRMRRLTLIHGVLSFVYNIAILAMSINIIGGVI